jgi:hypothetical protein
MHQVDCDGGREFQLQAFVFSLCSATRAEGDTVTPASAVLVSDHCARLCLSSYTDRARFTPPWMASCYAEQSRYRVNSNWFAEIQVPTLALAVS